MSTKAGGEGAANDATISTDEEAQEVADERPRLESAVESAKAKVERQKEHLAGAEAALAEAEAALAEVEG